MHKGYSDSYVSADVCVLSVCGNKNEHFERNRAVYGLYLLCTSHELNNISLYMPHKRERTSGSREKYTFFASLKVAFMKQLLPQLR